MEEDNTSTDSTQVVETPESDPILDILSDTEDTEAPAKAEEVVETPEQEPESETEPEVEPTKELEEEVEAPIDPKEEARRRYEERQAARQQAEQEREARLAKASDEHISAAENDADERLRAMEARVYADTVRNTENTLINEFETAKSKPELQIFNPDSDQFNQKAYDKAMRDYNAGYVTYDQNGNMVGLKGSLIEHLTETADLLQGAVKSGAVQQVKAARKMTVNADSKPAATPKTPEKDPILEILQSD